MNQRANWRITVARSDPVAVAAAASNFQVRALMPTVRWGVFLVAATSGRYRLTVRCLNTDEAVSLTSGAIVMHPF